MGKRYDVVTPLDCCVDLVLSGGDAVPRFGQQEQFIGDYAMEMGGSGCIFASQTAKLGLKTAGIGVTGEDAFGQKVRETLAGSGVDVKYLKRDGGVKTGLGVHICAENDRAILTYNGTIDGVAAGDFTDEIMKDARHLHIASFYLMERLRPHWPEIAKRAKGFGATVSLDTNWDPNGKWDDGLFELLPFVDVLLPNEQELLRISRRDDVREASVFMAEKVPLLVVKLGKDGAMAVSGGQTWKRKTQAAEVVDTVGAGDSFDGGFLWGFLNGLPAEECLAAGCFCGTANVTARGGTRGQASADQLNEYMAASLRSARVTGSRRGRS